MNAAHIQKQQKCLTFSYAMSIKNKSTHSIGLYSIHFHGRTTFFNVNFPCQHAHGGSTQVISPKTISHIPQHDYFLNAFAYSTQSHQFSLIYLGKFLSFDCFHCRVFTRSLDHKNIDELMYAEDLLNQTRGSVMRMIFIWNIRGENAFVWWQNVDTFMCEMSNDLCLRNVFKMSIVV